MGLRSAAHVAALVIGLVTVPGTFHAQTPTAAEHLKAGIAHMEAGDFILGLITLNEVTDPSARADAALTARAHVYKAHAYLGMNNSARARAAAALALEAQRDIDVSAPPFSAALVALFDDVRRTSALDPETAGAEAEKAGHFEEAFRAYMRAYQGMAEPVVSEDDRRLRERIINVSLVLPNEPAIPEAATKHFAKAMQLIEAEALLGGSSASAEAAAEELRKALRLAPWWPEATLRLAGVLQKLQRFEQALLNLNLYRMADPVGYAAAISGKAATTAPDRRHALSDVNAPSTATVHIYWPPQHRGKGRPKVYCDGFHIADLQNRRFIVLNVNPGTHDIRFNKTTETFSFEAGIKYYLRTSAEGLMNSGVIRQVSVEEGAAEIRNEKVTSNDPRRIYATVCAAPAPAGRSRR